MSGKVLTLAECDKLMAARAPEKATGLVWLHAYEEPLELTGFPWFASDHLYRRMPLKPSAEIPPAVDFLAWHTAGGKVRFTTDAEKVVIRVKLRDNKDSGDHMAYTGSCGFDLFTGKPGKERFYLVTRTKEKEYDTTLFLNPSRRTETLTIYFPLYQGVDELQIGVPPGSRIMPPEPLKKYAVVYGTSITQGGCASRPGMASMNILSRMLKRHIYNFGFSGSGQGEPEVARVLAQLDPAVYLLDFHANCVNHYQERLPGFLDILREAHPETPIVVVSKYRYSGFYNSYCRKVRKEMLEQQKHIEERRKNGDRNIWSIDGTDQLAPWGADATVDGAHATDLGFVLQAQFLLPKLRRVL